MENIKLLTDTCSDLPQDVLESNNIDYLEMTYVLDGVEYYSFDKSVSYEEFYDKISKGVPSSTSCINEETFFDKFESMTTDGSIVLYIAFSSSLSATYNNAVKAATRVNEKLGKEKVYVYDSLNASIEEGYLVLEASRLIKNGKSIKYIINELNHTPIMARFTVPDLMHLKRGGRLSGFSAVVGKLLKVQPMLICDTDGKLKVVDKIMGKKGVSPYFIKKMLSEIENVDNPQIYIGHGHNIEDANSLKADILKEIPGANVTIYYIGHVVGSHCGKGVLALFYKKGN